MADQKVIRPRRGRPLAMSALASSLGVSRAGGDVDVTGVAIHTDLVAPGDLFVAIAGERAHGIHYWSQARDRGAIAVLTDPAGANLLGDAAIPLLIADDPRELLGRVARAVYDTGAGDLPALFAVTGTNGKTSSAFLLEALMRALGWRTALSTTAERLVAGTAYASTLTTPEAPDIHAMIALAREESVAGIALEVSAQALEKHRLDEIVVDVAGFTNLSHDHFEDFGGMERYLVAKAALFTPERARAGVVCVDGEWGERLCEIATIPVWTIAEHSGPPAEWTYRVLEEGDSASAFEVCGPGGECVRLSAPVIGSHMVANAALATVMLIRGGVTPEDIEAAVGPGTPGIPVFLPGRIERVSGLEGPAVFVDAGRSEDAYRQTLGTVRQRTAGTVVMVCGTSGNRDATKRPLMGKAAAELADIVIITDDDPRREDPSEIRRGLLEGARSVPGAEVHEVADPSAAIRFALSLVGPGDSVLWSGPGSQAYRDIAGVKQPYSARDEARAALREAGWPAGETTHG